MATNKKKKKKSSSPSAASSQSNAAQVQGKQPGQVATSVSAVQAPVESDTQTNAEFAEEYGYVRKDLRQLVVVSLVLFAVMLGIGFFI